MDFLLNLFDKTLLFFVNNGFDLLHHGFFFIIIISVIVFIHEYGHYWVAKKCGVKIVTFSIGFGKELLGWTDKSGTRWKIAAVPLGGYVQMFGDEGAASTPDADKIKKLTPEEEKVAFHTQPLLAKSAIVLAGPAANFILAVFILTFLFIAYGKPETLPVVGEVTKGSAAQQIGLQSGDKIIELDGTTINWFEDLQGIAQLNPDTKLSITYIRNGKEIKNTITPKLQETKSMFGDPIKVGMLGIRSNERKDREVSLISAPWEAVKKTYSVSAQTLTALGQIITGKRSADELSGMPRIAYYIGEAAQMGFSTMIWIAAVISINLGLINLFPIPMLDGGHLLFYTIEAGSGRPLAEKVQEYAFRVGFVLLIALMLFATFNDLKFFDIL